MNDKEQIIENVNINLLKEAYNFYLKDKPYYFLPLNSSSLDKFFANSIDAQQLVDFGLAKPISNVGSKTFSGALSFSLTEFGVKIAKDL